jgi:DNA-directed RNA polymerase I subunit RPA2
MAPAATSTEWSTGFDTARRQQLFRNPPKDKTAYPTLAETVDPHINSFNALFARGGQIDESIKEIGTKVFLDGDLFAPPEDARNRLHVRIQEVFLEKSMLPVSNKVTLKDRRILPAEARERHVTYRGKLSARIQWKVNGGDWQELVRDLGYVPLMLRVRSPYAAGPVATANCARDSPTGATSRA